MRMRRALIVGGSRGIGLGLVEEHLARGWNVVATERTISSELHALATENPDRLSIEKLDIRNQGQQRELADRLADQTFDLLFLNAGILFGRGTSLAEIADDDVADKFLTNAVGPVRTADALFNIVRDSGMIAFMSSFLGSVSKNDDGRAELYRASKAALNSLVLSFHARHHPSQKTVLLLHPGVVRTDMGGADAPLDIATRVKGHADVLEQRWGEQHPLFVDYNNQIIPW